MYRCQFCQYQSRRLIPYLGHQKFHSNLSQSWHCGYNGCKKQFKLQGSLRAHLLRTHVVVLKGANRNNTSTLCTASTKFICSVELCKKEFDSSNAIVKHLKVHMRGNEKVKCPFRGCNKEYNRVQSFTGHLSKNHRNASVTSTSRLAVKAVSERENVPLNESFSDDYLDFAEDITDQNIDDNVDGHIDNQSSDQFLLKVAQLYLKLESQLLVPVSTIQKVVSETLSVHEQSQELVKQNLETRLLKENLLPSQVDKIANEVFGHDPFLESTNKMNTDYKRKIFYKDHCSFVQPIEVLLRSDHEEKVFFHYVPIEETLKQLFTDKSLGNEFHNDCEMRKNEILRDFTDGSAFQNSAFFRENPNAIKLILYQDAFEVVNPIGSAVHTHKLIGIYLAIGNFPEHIRSHVNSIKLVALCKEKYFDHEKVYGKIVDDLKTIESVGIQMSSGEFVKGALAFIAGDNLGSHALGGFLENFSMAIYFCRYCLITRDEFHTDRDPLKVYERRTIENYNNALQKKGENQSYQGIKFNSKFNELKSYHVCESGLPPCLGHDLFEGVVAYDLHIFIKYFIEKQWFSLSLLNKRIESFEYSIEDRRDKPCSVSEKRKRIVGGAWQIFIFLKLFPLFIADMIRDSTDYAWRSVLLLLEISEIICAPAIHKSCLPYLRSIVSEYISLRKQIGPKLRPKHHYLTHYPELILKFGPLMKVWTMRFESKHTYFKRALRYTKNYINVTKSMSEKHELFQSFLRLGADIRAEIEMKGESDFQIDLYQDSIKAAVGRVNLPRGIQECNEIRVRGIVYRKSDCLVVNQKGYQYEVEIGKISILLSNEQSVFVVCEVLETSFYPDIRVYQIGNRVRYECLALNELPSTEKLRIHNNGTFLCVKPSFGLVAQSL